MHIRANMMDLREIAVKLLGFCIGAAIVGASLPVAAQAAATHYQLDIPREPLDRALKDFAHQTGLQIARFADVSGGDAQVGPVTGSLTSEEALNTLLRESELTYRVLNDRMIAVVRKQAVSGPGSAEALPSSDEEKSRTTAPGESSRKDEPKARGSFWDRFRVAQVDSGASATGSSVRKDNERDSSDKSGQIEEIVVTGIRYSLKESLAAKRAAPGIVEVVTSEDIGKLPDKNVADVLQRVPGVNTQSAASGEGGFDENNRVSIRGTGASLTQTTINGHSVATGDWFALDQYQTVGRSVSFDLLPSEIIQRTVVSKTQSADLIEGGVAGSVDLQTPKPLEFKQTFTASALAGGVYSDLPSKTQPQANVLVNWQNGQMGVLAMGFYEKRSSRRDGQETLGYLTVPQATAAAWQAANPSLPNATGALIPMLIGETLFNQTRKREGGLLDFEVKPTDALTLDLNGFYSHLDADNTNGNFLFFGNNIVSPAYVPTALTIAPNGTVLSGTWPTIPGAPIADTLALPYNTAVYDQVVRPSSSETYYIDLDASLVATDRLTLDSQLGFTHGVGSTDQESYVETQGGNGGSYTLHGIDSPVSVSYPGLNPADPNQFFTGYAFGNISHAIDKETYGQVNALYKLDSGLFQSLKFGARFAAHTRDSFFPEKNGCNPGFCGADAALPVYGGGTYPSNFGNGLGGSGYPTNIYTYSPGAILAFDANALSHGPSRFYWPGEFQVKENTTALYAMANVGAQGWSGNFGVRLARTAGDSIVNVAGGTNPITTSAFGDYTQTRINNNYFDILPSLNLKFDLTPDLVLRASTARSIARPDYSALGGAVSLTDLTDTGNGGNPHLKPVRSANYDTSLEWYYAPQSLLEVGFFYMDMSSYIDFGNTVGTYFNQQFGKFEQYTISSPFNTTAAVKGVEVAWTQPLGLGFGAAANFTYADGRTGQDTPMVGNSKFTYNIGGYYEAYGFSAHLDYTFRSHYLVGLDRSSAENEDDIGNLDAALNYSFNKNIGLSLNALNLTNQTIKYYAADTNQPRAFYSNGRQYYFEVRLKL